LLRKYREFWWNWISGGHARQHLRELVKKPKDLLTRWRVPRHPIGGLGQSRIPLYFLDRLTES